MTNTMITSNYGNCCKPSEYEELRDVIKMMRRQESEVYCRCRGEGDDEESSSSCKESDDGLRKLWRRLLIEWMYFVVDHCKLQRESVAAGAFFLDVAIARGFATTREEHQLAAATCLQLALKTFDRASIKLDKLVRLGRDLFTKNDVVELEFKILKALNWHMHPPSTYCFLRQYERLLPSSLSPTTHRMIGEVMKLVAELVISDESYNRFPPSVVAYSGMLMAMELIDDINLPVHQRHCFVLNMSSVAHQESKSSLVLAAFEELKNTLDNSSKLHGLMKSIEAATHRKSKKRFNNYSKTKRINTVIQSPRHVMACGVRE